MTQQHEQRKLVALRMLPTVHRQAEIAAVVADKTLGQWMEEAIREKLERDGGQDGKQRIIITETRHRFGRQSAVLVPNPGWQKTTPTGAKNENRGSRCLSFAYR